MTVVRSFEAPHNEQVQACALKLQRWFMYLHMDDMVCALKKELWEGRGWAKSGSERDRLQRATPGVFLQCQIALPILCAEGNGARSVLPVQTWDVRIALAAAADVKCLQGVLLELRPGIRPGKGLHEPAHRQTALILQEAWDTQKIGSACEMTRSSSPSRLTLVQAFRPFRTRWGGGLRSTWPFNKMWLAKTFSAQVMSKTPTLIETVLHGLGSSCDKLSLAHVIYSRNGSRRQLSRALSPAWATPDAGQCPREGRSIMGSNAGLRRDRVLL